MWIPLLLILWGSSQTCSVVSCAACNRTQHSSAELLWDSTPPPLTCWTEISKAMFKVWRWNFWGRAWKKQAWLEPWLSVHWHVPCPHRSFCAHLPGRAAIPEPVPAASTGEQLRCATASCITTLLPNPTPVNTDSIPFLFPHSSVPWCGASWWAGGCNIPRQRSVISHSPGNIVLAVLWGCSPVFGIAVLWGCSQPLWDGSVVSSLPSFWDGSAMGLVPAALGWQCRGLRAVPGWKKWMGLESGAGVTRGQRGDPAWPSALPPCCVQESRPAGSVRGTAERRARWAINARG